MSAELPPEVREVWVEAMARAGWEAYAKRNAPRGQEFNNEWSWEAAPEVDRERWRRDCRLFLDVLLIPNDDGECLLDLAWEQERALLDQCYDALGDALGHIPNLPVQGIALDRVKRAIEAVRAWRRLPERSEA